MLGRAKKLFFMSAILALSLVFAACGGGQSQSTNKQAVEPVKTAKESRILVAYYSATGNTERVSKVIAETLKADTFVITPKDPYTSADLNYRDENSRVIREHNDENRHTELAQITPDNFNDYDIVFFGYPLWWREAAWIVDDFVKGNNFSDKRVIPFTTSTSNGVGDSVQKLKDMAGTGTWDEGKRFGEHTSQSEIEEWVKELKL